MPGSIRSQGTPPPPPPISPTPPTEERIDDSKLDRNHENEPTEEEHDSDGSLLSENGDRDGYVTVNLAEIRKELQCPICLGIIRKTRTVMECLHRFCRECIDKSIRLGNNECPACRTHCASRRSLRDDPNYDTLIAILYPDIDKYEEEELAFHEEEKARNKQLQDTIAQTMKRQSEALVRKRTANATAAIFARRSQVNRRNLRGGRNVQADDFQVSDDEDVSGHGGGKDSSSDGCSPVIKPKRNRKWDGRFSQSSTAASVDAPYVKRDTRTNREPPDASVELGGSSEILAWGKGGIRSHKTHNRHAKISRISKLIDHLQSSEENENLDVNLILVSLSEEEMPGLQRPCLSCQPNLSVAKLCTYVSAWTGTNADEIDIFIIKDPHSTIAGVESITEFSVANLHKNDLHILQQDQKLGEIRATSCNFNQRFLILGYRRKLQTSN